MDDILITIGYLILGVFISYFYTALASGEMMHFCVVAILSPAIVCLIVESFYQSDYWLGFCLSAFSVIPIAMRCIAWVVKKSGDIEIAVEIFYYRYLVCVPIGIFFFLLFTLGTWIDYLDSPRMYPRRKL